MRRNVTERLTGQRTWVLLAALFAIGTIAALLLLYPSIFPHARQPPAESGDVVDGAGPRQPGIPGRDIATPVIGVVVSATDGFVAEADIELWWTPSAGASLFGHELRRLDSTVSDTRGRFRFAVSRGPRGTFLVVTRARGFASDSRSVHWRGPHPEPVEVRLVKDAFRLRGEVRALRSDVVVSGARVVVRPLSQSGALVGRTDDRGRFEFDGIPHGNTEVVVDAPGYAPFRKVVPADRKPEQDIVLRVSRGVTITGTVRDAATGIPIEGARVHPPEWTIRAVRTSAGGDYTYVGYPMEGGVLEGTLVASAAGHVKRELALDFPCDPMPDRVRLDISLHPGVVLHGQVHGMDGQPLAEAAIRTLEGTAHATADATGEFVLPPIQPGPEGTLVTIEASLRGYYPTRTGIDCPISGPLAVPPLILVRRNRGRTTLRGRVLVDRAPASPIKIESFAPIAGGRAILAGTTCDNERRFALELPRDLGAVVVARIGDAKSSPMRVRAGFAEELVIPFDSGALEQRLRVRFEGDGDPRLFVRREGDAHWRDERSLGTVRTLRLPPGSWEFVAAGPGVQSRVRRLELPSSTSELVLHSGPPTGTLDARIGSDTGPVRNARVVVYVAPRLGPCATALSGHDGVATIDGIPAVPGLPLAILVQAEGRQACAFLVAPTARGVQLRLVAPAKRSLLVVGPDGAPLVGATVAVGDAMGRPILPVFVSPDRTNPDLTRSGHEDETDRRGRVIFDSVPGGDYAIRVVHPRFGTIRRSLNVDRDWADTATVRVRD